MSGTWKNAGKKFKSRVKAPTLEAKQALAEDFKCIRAKRAYYEQRLDDKWFEQARTELLGKMARVQVELTKLESERKSAPTILADIARQEGTAKSAVLQLKNFKNIKRLQELAMKALAAAEELKKAQAEEAATANQ
jgi:hypothetical protein